MDTMEELHVDERDYEEFKDSISRLNKDIDYALDNTLNKSHLTMEDNNKASKLSKPSILSEGKPSEAHRISNNNNNNL